MQNVKKWIAAVLVLALALSTTAFAAVDDTGYSDVDAGTAYAEAILYCREHDLMEGVGGNRFDPDGPLTRAALATVLYRMEGEPAVTGTDAFTDTDGGQWYSDAVLWASQRGLMEGYGGGVFGINDPVTRQDMTTTLWRYADSPAAECASRYEDESAIAGYAAAAVNWAGANGIVAPVSGSRFAPRENASRGQIAAALMNFSLNAQPKPGEGQKVLVAYFSGTGTTRGVAENIVAALGRDVATLHEIIPGQPYTAADLDYTNSNCRSVTEQRDPSARPAISNSVSNMEQYDVVFLGYPIWNNDAPRVIYTFLERENLSGKTVVPFCTSGGSGIANSVSNIRGLAGGATWLAGRRFSGGTSRDTIIEWVNSLNPGIR